MVSNICILTRNGDLMQQNLRNDWEPLLQNEYKSASFLKLQDFLNQEYQNEIVYPNRDDIYNALILTPFAQVKVVILGQDPYHGPGQAHGLCFSVQPGIPTPPSLRNIYKEIHQDCGCPIPQHGCLTDWAKQGVLLLNTVLTVRQHEPTSHRKKGWEHFTDQVIVALNLHPQPLVFLLWGNHARSKKGLITNPNHLVLEAAHPSPLSASRGFMGCRHFSQTNAFLQAQGRSSIDWCL